MGKITAFEDFINRRSAEKAFEKACILAENECFSAEHRIHVFDPPRIETLKNHKAALDSAFKTLKSSFEQAGKNYNSHQCVYRGLTQQINTYLDLAN